MSYFLLIGIRISAQSNWWTVIALNSYCPFEGMWTIWRSYLITREWERYIIKHSCNSLAVYFLYALLKLFKGIYIHTWDICFIYLFVDAKFSFFIQKIAHIEVLFLCCGANLVCDMYRFARFDWTCSLESIVLPCMQLFDEIKVDPHVSWYNFWEF